MAGVPLFPGLSPFFIYNSLMLMRILPVIFILAFAAGCATTEEYNPVQTATSETFLLNEKVLQDVRMGMTQEQVHNLMGQQLTVGYEYQDSSTDDSQPKPVTIANPYRTKDVQTLQGSCTVEYYVTAIHHPDGVISEDELMPLVFCKGVLTAKGKGADTPK